MQSRDTFHAAISDGQCSTSHALSSELILLHSTVNINQTGLGIVTFCEIYFINLYYFSNLFLLDKELHFSYMTIVVFVPLNTYAREFY